MVMVPDAIGKGAEDAEGQFAPTGADKPREPDDLAGANTIEASATCPVIVM